MEGTRGGGVGLCLELPLRRHLQSDRAVGRQKVIHRTTELAGSKVLKNKSDRMDYETFLQTPIFSRFTPQDCADMIHFMQSHPDIYVATDMKENEVKEGYLYIVNLAKDMNAEEILNRIIVSVYNYKDYYIASEIYPFKNFVLRIFGSNNNYYELAEFCIKNGIHVVNVWTTYMEDEGIKLLTDKGINIITAVVDSISDMQEYRKLGSSGCVSNFLYEDIYDYSRP